MLRDVAVQRISDGLGFWPAGHSKEATIILRMQEAQRDLERGKTLPRFLLQVDQTLNLLAGGFSVSLPAGFLRDSDESPIHYFDDDAFPVYLARKYFIEVDKNFQTALGDTAAPTTYAIRGADIQFDSYADQAYTLYWSFYKAADLLTSNIENAWLANAPEWLIGFAGKRMAADVRDADAVSLFQDMEKSARAAWFADDIALELSGGPLVMGANL